jgi:alanine dehydrogenase
MHGVVHYCVPNMPGAVPHTSTWALTNVTISHAVQMAEQGFFKALRGDPVLRAGLNTHAGNVTCQPVARAHGLEYVPASELL